MAPNYANSLQASLLKIPSHLADREFIKYLHIDQISIFTVARL